MLQEIVQRLYINLDQYNEICDTDFEGWDIFNVSLRSRAIHVKMWRVRSAIQIVDPISRALRHTFAVVRRIYNVCCSNALF